MHSIGTSLWFCFAFVAPAQLPDYSGLRPIPTDHSTARSALSPEARGDIFMARKMYREAAEVYRQPPENPILANKIGIAFHQMTALSDAKRQYERAVRLKPNYSEAINNLGTIYYVNPNSASIYSNLGTAFFARKKYDEAFDAYQKALSIDPEVFEHRSTQGVLLQERNVTERAKFHYYLAKTYAKSGNAERALDYMRKSIEEGFKERNKFLEEPEFASLQANPDFQMLLKLESRVL